MQRNTYIFSMLLASISMGILVGIIMEAIDNPLKLSEFGLIVFSIPINLMLLLIFTSPIFILIRNVTQALTRINEGKTTKPIEHLPKSFMQNFTQQVNTLITNQQEFQAARGRLYDQISEVAAQEERKRLARDLHDSIKQQVFSISISAAAAHAHLENNPSAAREALIDVKQSAQEAMVEMRALLQQLSPAPLEKSGLIEALREQSEAFSYRTGAKIETHFGALPDDERLPTGTQETIFRIAQEALSNIARHARAQNVLLKLTVGDNETLHLIISDDGQGFDRASQPTGMGINNIQSRAESINAITELQSEVGKGTTLHVTIPFVEPIIDERDLFKEYEEQGKAIILRYWWWSGATAAVIFSIVLLLERFIDHSDDFAPDIVTQVITIVLFIIPFIAIPITIIAWRQASTQTSAIIQVVGRNSRTDYWLRRHHKMAMIIVAVCCAWFVPILTINPQISNWFTVVTGLEFTTLIGIFTYQMYTMYRDELRLMRPTERIEELSTRLRELRVSWLSIGFLIFVQVISAGLGEGYTFSPATEDQWMNTSSLVITILLIINQIVTIFVYRNWREQAEQERKFA